MTDAALMPTFSYWSQRLQSWLRASSGVGVLLALFLPAQSSAAAAQLQDCNAPAHFSVLHASASPAIPAQAYWLDRYTAQWPGVSADPASRFRLLVSQHARLALAANQTATGVDFSVPVQPSTRALDAQVLRRFSFIGSGVRIELPLPELRRLPQLLQAQVWLVQEDAQGKVLRSSALQLPGALDDLYAAAENLDDLGAHPGATQTGFRLWAPTARDVALCVFDSASAPARTLHLLRRDDTTGSWSVQLPTDLSGSYYQYLVDVWVPGVGVVRNRVTDPYSLSLSTDSRRSYITTLDAASVTPIGWAQDAAPQRISSSTDMVVYELHVRDFSISDASVGAAHQGKYLAFTHPQSAGMRHLSALSRAGLTDVHLLPVFDFGSVPESGCLTPQPQGLPDGETQQASVNAVKEQDCFNWGYDPVHYTAPEGSYASDASDGAVRLREFRQMVMALHRTGLRVGMDVVYNHTFAAGQDAKSVLDRIVPGYYHRLNDQGQIERSTCCDNTATEHRMMGKLMIDSAVTWARAHHIDSFRFDLMAHQPRELMERLQRSLKTASGRTIPLIGEGWNFGEVADGRRFVQASQLSLNGTGIGSFSDRARDAVRGGGAGDSGAAMINHQGYVNGLVYDPNGSAPAPDSAALKRSADLVRVGLAGSLRDYRLLTASGTVQPLAAMDYAGQPAGYASQPSEVVNYVENHDNQTLFDNNAMKLPRTTSSEDRARVQILAVATTAFSQGVAYFHAGVDVLRSKSLDRNSFNSGDWFNRLDWTYQTNHFGSGLPPSDDNAANWPLMRPLLGDASIAPTPHDIAWTRDAFRDLLAIRASTMLLRLPTGELIKSRLHFFNTGSDQEPTVLMAHLDGHGLAGSGFAELVYAINVDTVPHRIEVPALKSKPFTLHPVHLAPQAADPRPKLYGRYEPGTGGFTVPPRTALVWVLQP